MATLFIHPQRVRVSQQSPGIHIDATECEDASNGACNATYFLGTEQAVQIRDELLELLPLPLPVPLDHWTCGVCGENTCRYASVKNKWVNGPIRCPIGNPCEIEAAWIKDGAPPEEPPVAEADDAAREVDGEGRIVDPLWAAADEFARVFWTDDTQIAACRDKILAVCQAMEVKTDGSK